SCHPRFLPPFPTRRSSDLGDKAVNAVQNQPWDPSVMSLAAFPSVLDMMGRQPDWVRSVGDAFLDQPDDVMNSVQRLRLQAQKARSEEHTSELQSRENLVCR